VHDETSRLGRYEAKNASCTRRFSADYDARHGSARKKCGESSGSVLVLSHQPSVSNHPNQDNAVIVKKPASQSLPSGQDARHGRSVTLQPQWLCGAIGRV
jgi:hypothetical protein